MKTALAGTATTKFIDVMEAVFGVDEEEAPELEPTPVDDEEEYIPPEMMTTKGEAEMLEEAEDDDDEDYEAKGAVGGGVSSTTSTKRVTRSSVSQSQVAPKSKRKSSTPQQRRVSPFDIKKATPCYPTRSNKKNYLHTGVDDKYVKERCSGQYTKFSFYACNYARAMREMGLQTPECDAFNQNKGQTSTHVRAMHLDKCLACYICNYRTWSGDMWRKHFPKKHPTLHEDDWFVGDSFVPPDFEVKAEVDPSVLMEALQ